MLKLLRFMMVMMVLAILAIQPALSGMPAAGAANSVPATVVDGFSPNPDSIVDAILIQPDGKILLGGQFNKVGGMNHVGVARIYPDGSLDNSFNPATDLNDLAHPNYVINALALQKDGKILVGGQYATLNGQPHPNLGRLNPDGTLDASFNPTLDLPVDAVIVQPDGKILVAGDFNVVNKQLHPRIARLNPDGSSDDSFIASADGEIYAMQLQLDGKILIGGRFGGVNNHSQPFFARLNADGTTDSGFGGAVNGNAFNGYVNSLALQPDGMILVGGGITGSLLRFKTDGSRDTFFHPTLDDGVGSVAVQPDGKIVISGAFRHINSQSHYHLGRINNDGTPDSSFNAATDGVAFTITMQSNGGILLGGNFNNVDNDLIQNPPNHPLIARLYPDGSLDDALDTEADQAAYALARQPDGKLLLGGSFTMLQASYAHLGLGRLDAGGTLDMTYNAFATGGTFPVLALGIQPDSKVIAVGDFTKADTIAHIHLARLKPDGTLDSAFTASTSANLLHTVDAMVLPQYGETVIGGLFTSVNGTTRSNLARLTTNGDLDTSFQASANGIIPVNALALQPDGKILVGGSFTLLDSLSHPNLGRLNPNGTLDGAFAPVVDGPISAIAVQHDGKILIAGVLRQRRQPAARAHRPAQPGRQPGHWLQPRRQRGLDLQPRAAERRQTDRWRLIHHDRPWNASLPGAAQRGRRPGQQLLHRPERPGARPPDLAGRQTPLQRRLYQRGQPAAQPPGTRHPRLERRERLQLWPRAGRPDLAAERARPRAQLGDLRAVDGRDQLQHVGWRHTRRCRLELERRRLPHRQPGLPARPRGVPGRQRQRLGLADPRHALGHGSRCDPLPTPHADPIAHSHSAVLQRDLSAHAAAKLKDLTVILPLSARSDAACSRSGGG